jgi:glycosyltransferase involved in cell wall biosynthesis
MRKKVLHLLPTNKIGGVEVAAISSVNFLARSYDFRLGYVFDYENKSILHKTFSLIKTLINLLNNPPEIIITSLWLPVVIALPLKVIYRKEIIWIHFVHNTVFFHFFDRIFNRLGLAHCNYIFTDSNSTKLFVKRMTDSPNFVISFLLNRKLFKSSVNEIRSSNISFVFLGRVAKQKNLELAFIVISKLKNEGYNVKFDIYGPLEMNKEELDIIIKNLKICDNVFFKGSVPQNEVEELFKLYDFYLQTSHVEGMALSVVQAMQNGLVCLVTPCGEIVNYSEDMVSAVHLLASNDNALKEFVEKIISLINDQNLYNQISNSASAVFSDKLTYKESMYESLNSIIKQ